ncbi:MAG: SDR family oxidoreductase [Myxococcales bacterium]
MILVTGAMGNVGSELVRELLRAGRPVRALVRGEDRAVPAGISGAEIAVGDLDRPESLGAALRGARGVLLLGGRADMLGLLEEIRRAGVEHVVLLTSRSVVGGNRTNAIVAMWMASEAAVRSSGVPWTILRPSGFMSNALRWLPQLRAGDLIRAPFAEVSIAVIDPHDIAAVAAAVMGSERQHGLSHELSGPEALVPAEQVRVLGAALGRELRFEGQREDKAREELGKVFPPSFVEAQLRFFAQGEFDDSRVVATVSEITGRPAGTFAQWARSHADRFR